MRAKSALLAPRVGLTGARSRRAFTREAFQIGGVANAHFVLAIAIQHEVVTTMHGTLRM